MINRDSLIQGPARAAFAAPSGAVSFYSKNDLEPKIDRQTFKLATSQTGQFDERDEDYQVKLDLTPDGRWTAALIAALWPYGNTIRGTPLWTNTDRALALHASNGYIHTLIAAAITKMPNILFSSRESLIGSAEFTGLRGNAMEVSDESSLYTIATNGATFADAAFATALVKTQKYTLSVAGLTGFSDQDSEKGFAVEFSMTTQQQRTNNVGVLNYFFDTLEMMVKFAPVGVTEAQLLAAMKVQGAGAGIGASSAARGAQLTIVGADGITYLTIPNASLKTAGYRFGSTVLRNGEVAFVGNRTFAAGVQQSLFTLAAA